MLILTRKIGEGIRIGGDLVITVKEIKGRQVRLGISAPNELPVYREELFQAMTASNRDAVMPDKVTDSVLELLSPSSDENSPERKIEDGEQ